MIYIIKIENLKKYYGKYKGIENISLEIKNGEVFGLIGPNGAGKTTTIRCLMGFITQDEGTVLIENQKPHNIINKIGYLPGEVNFYDYMKVKDFFEYNNSFYKNIDKKYQNELIEYLEVDINKKFSELSMGNKKKVAIITSISHDPDYIIMDEPTNGLDPLLQNKLYEIIKDLKSKNKTILFSSHILSEVEKTCDRVAIVKEGLIIKESTIEEIKSINKKIIKVFGQKGDIKDFNNKKKNNHIEYEVNTKDLKVFFKSLSNIDFEDIDINNPSLEEIFMEYYK